MSVQQEYQKRVIAESKDLSTKLDNLKDFFNTEVYKTISPDEKARLIVQSHYMRGYLNILGERIANFI